MTDRRLWILVGLLTLAGLAIRIVCAQGGLWLDEAWSAFNAHEVQTPLGVFLKINHDNNHHINTLWLQLVGFDAPPLAQRALAIATGTLAIPLAAMLAGRQGRGAAAVAALLFAVSPLLVTFGAEARGYAPMLLALLGTALIVARWLDDTKARVPWLGLVLVELLGLFSQLTMAFGIAAVFSWVAFVLLRTRPWRQAVRDGLRIVPALAIPIALAFGAVFAAGLANGTGLQFGNIEPFSFAKLFDGLGAMLLVTAGGPIAMFALLPLVLPPDTPGSLRARSRDRLFYLLLLTIPLGIIVLQLRNSGAPRYLLLAGVGVLLLAAVNSGPRLEQRRWIRWLVGAALALVTVAALITDWRIALNRRADPDAAVAAMMAREPGGAQAAVDHPRSEAVLRALSAAHHYPIAVVEAPCPAPRFLFVDRDGGQSFPHAPERCGARYHVIAEAGPTGLSGLPWKLYERDK